ncbi:MAG: Hsp33 family molecular chaperone HslO [Bacillota bacterium]
MSDHIATALIANGTVRAFVAETTELVQEAATIHKLSPVATAALGRLLTGAAIMGSMLKSENDTLSLQIKSDGPLEGLIAVSDSSSNVRGYVHRPLADLPLREDDGKLDVGGAVGKGVLTVVKDLGMKEPYVSQVELISGEIGVDLTYYFASSEQTPSVVALGVLINPDLTVANAGGYVFQLLPGADDSIISYIENTIDSMPPVTTLLSWGETPESILDLFFAEKDLQILDTRPCQYKCNCSRDRMERGLISLGANDLEEMANDPVETECVCHFCSKIYKFNKEDLFQLINP